MLLLCTMLLAACGSAPQAQGTAPQSSAVVEATAEAAASPSAAAGVATSQSTEAAPSAAVTPSTEAAPSAAASPSAAAGATADATAASDTVSKSPAAGVPDAYLALPAPFTAVQGAPGKGQPVTTLQVTFNPVPNDANNQYWAEFEKRLGVDYRPIITTYDAYAEKLNALTAAGDLPDLTFLDLAIPAAAAVQRRAIDQGAYTDLTPYLTGDALNQYPNLAAFPPQVWENSKIGGKIYGVPRPRPLTRQGLFFRQDWMDKLNLKQPTNADEVYAMMEAFTKQDPDGNGQADTYGLGFKAADIANVQPLAAMFGVPDEWKLNEDGTLTSRYDTPQYKNYIAFMRKLYENGLIFPDSLSQNDQQIRDNFTAGKYGTSAEQVNSLPKRRQDVAKVSPGANVMIMVLPGHDGGEGAYYTGTGYYGIVAIPASVGKDEARVKELLGILNYLAAPFGSEERIFLDQGIAGVHYEMQNGKLKPNSDLLKQERGDIQSLSNNPAVFYYPDAPEDALMMQELTQKLLAQGVSSPLIGTAASSPTQDSRGAELQQFMTDGIVAIVTGRQPLESLDTLVADWKGRGGEQIAREYAETMK